MAEVTLRWPTARSNPIHPEWEERTYSGTTAAAEAVIELGHDVWVQGIRVTVADAKRELDIRAQVKADREAAWAASEAEAKPKRERLTRARREAVAVALVAMEFGKDDAGAAEMLDRFELMRVNFRAKAARVIAAYEGVA